MNITEMKTNIKHIIFDLDGVLMDSKDAHAIAFVQACNENGVKITREEHDRQLCGLPTKEKLNRIEKLSDLIEPIMKDRIFFRKQEITQKILLENVQKDYDLIAAMNYLGRHCGLTFSCCTNSIHTTTVVILGKLGIIDLFKYIITNDSIWIPHLQKIEHHRMKCKPAPNFYNAVSKIERLFPNEILIIEDSPIGKQAIEAFGGIPLMVKNRSEVTLNNIIRVINENPDTPCW